METSSKIYLCYASEKELKDVGADPKTMFVNIAENRREFPPDEFSLTQVELTKEQAQKLIPEGDYCYKILNGPSNSKLKIKTCPFWDKILDFPTQNNGYCHYLNKGDWQFKGAGLLWDQCKECGENDCNDGN